jgi:hypothetical protein
MHLGSPDADLWTLERSFLLPLLFHKSCTEWQQQAETLPNSAGPLCQKLLLGLTTAAVQLCKHQAVPVVTLS